MPEFTNLREEDINNTITTVQQGAPIWDYTTTRIDNISCNYEILDNRVKALEVEIDMLQPQLSELMRRSGMRCNSLL